MADTKGYELKATELNLVTSKPGDPLAFKTYRQGDTVQLDSEQAERFLSAGAVVDPDAGDKGEAGAQTEAPKGDAEDGDAENSGEPAGTGDRRPSRRGSGQGNAGATS